MKTYTKRTNAKRAAIAAGIPEAQVEITVHKAAGEEPRFGFAKKETAAVAPAKAVAAAKGRGAAKAPAKVRDVRAGIVRPRSGGACAAVWAWCEKNPETKLPGVRAWAEKSGHNANNAMIEFYRWRKFSQQPSAGKG